MKKIIYNLNAIMAKPNLCNVTSLGMWLMAILFNTNGNAQSLVFKNGFEGTTRVENRTAEHDLIKGYDNLTSPSDWEKDLVANPYFGSGQIYYQTGDYSQRQALVVADPDPAGGTNKVMRFRITNQHILMPNGERKARIQYNLQNQKLPPAGGYIKQYYQKCRMRLSEDFKVLEDAPDAIGWIILQEFWNDPQDAVPGATQVPKQTRVDFGIHRNRNAVGEKLRFGASFRDPINVYPATWELPKLDSDFEIPLGKWMTQEIYVKEGDENTGRIYMAITVDGKKTVIVDKITRTVSKPTATYTPDGQTSWNPIKIYTEGKVAKRFFDNNKIMDVYWDDLEIWFNRTPESVVDPKMIVKQATVTIPDNTGTHSFGSVAVGTSVTRQFTIENPALLPLNLSGTPRVTITGAGFTRVVDAPVTISSGGTATFDIKFEPLTAGSFTGTISIANNDPLANPYNFAITGAATLAAPAMPTSFNASNVQPRQLTLSWVDNATNETGFVLDRRNVTTGESYALLQNLGADVVNYVDTTVLPGNSYQYRILARNATAQSAYI
jgi:hypothetical protein